MGLPAGLTAALVLLAIAALHGYWAEGGRWPGRDGRELAERVIGPDMPPPPRYASWIVATLLLAAAVLVGLRALSVENWIVTAGTITTVAVLAVRGVGGLVWSGLVKRGSTFARLDRRIYSPLCLSLAGLVSTVLLV